MNNVSVFADKAIQTMHPIFGEGEDDQPYVPSMLFYKCVTDRRKEMELI